MKIENTYFNIGDTINVRINGELKLCTVLSIDLHYSKDAKEVFYNIKSNNQITRISESDLKDNLVTYKK